MNLSVVPFRQQVAAQRIEDVAGTVRAGLRAIPLRERVQPGMCIAVGVGSRGISCLCEVVRALVEELRALGAEPFLVPAMGSHGGGTAEGQRTVLEGYGLTSHVLGVPILSSMDTVLIGMTDGGMPVYWDSHAASADGIIVVNRIKQHTAFHGKWESGLLKILAVGLGKAAGAAEIHNWGIVEAMPAAARFLLANLPIIAGIGIVENGLHEPACIEVLSADRIEAEEPKLLDLARQMLPRIPDILFPLDVLVLREIGKDISGTGMDLNLVGMWRRTGGVVDPPIDRLVVLDLTGQSHGNAIGVGYADVIPQRLRDKIDPAATNTNCLSSHNWSGGRIPITLPTDADVIKTGIAGVAPERVRMMLIQNTLELETFWVTRALADAAQSDARLEQLGPARPLACDSAGNLIWPEVG
jgi:Lactate racemase N-terminal domain